MAGRDRDALTGEGQGRGIELETAAERERERGRERQRCPALAFVPRVRSQSTGTKPIIRGDKYSVTEVRAWLT